jgi:NAD(P)-dependent dehydrogenase (short-subunit alcohol dehydrogenase family)
VELFHRHGAYVVFGDVNDEEGISFEKALGQFDLLVIQVNIRRCAYIRADVQSWTSLATLFAMTMNACGRIDIVIANAGLQTKSFWEDKMNGNGELQEPDWRVIDTNLKGIMATVKLAHHYFDRNPQKGGRCIIIGSPDGYLRGSKRSGLHAEYVASEHAVRPNMSFFYSRGSRSLDSCERRPIFSPYKIHRSQLSPHG